MAFVLYIANHDSLSQFPDIKYCVSIMFQTNFFSLKHIRATTPLASHMPPQISMTPRLRPNPENCLPESPHYGMISSEAATPLVITKNHILYCAARAIENLAWATCFYSPTISTPLSSVLQSNPCTPHNEASLAGHAKWKEGEIKQKKKKKKKKQKPESTDISDPVKNSKESLHELVILR